MFLDLHDIYVDDQAYHIGHGYAFRTYGVHADRPEVLVLVRPDQCE